MSQYRNIIDIYTVAINIQFYKLQKKYHYFQSFALIPEIEFYSTFCGIQSFGHVVIHVIYFYFSPCLTK